MTYNGTIYRPPVEANSLKSEGLLRDEKQQMLDALAWSIDHVKENAIHRTSRVGTL